MSRNQKLRQVSKHLDKVGQVPKLINGRIQKDTSGNIIYTTHAREILSIKSKMKEKGFGPKHPETLKAIAAYSAKVLAYNKAINKRSFSERAMVYILYAGGCYLLWQVWEFIKHLFVK